MWVPNGYMKGVWKVSRGFRNYICRVAGWGLEYEKVNGELTGAVSDRVPGGIFGTLQN